MKLESWASDRPSAVTAGHASQPVRLREAVKQRGYMGVSAQPPPQWFQDIGATS